MKAVKKWVGQGGRATLADAPDADILREILELLRMRIEAGRATFFVKVKSHRGEPLNERADTLAEKGRARPEDEKRWNERTDRMTFTVTQQGNSKTSVWTDSVRNAFRKQAGQSKTPLRMCTSWLRETGPGGYGTPGIRGGCSQLGQGERQQRVASSKMSRHGGKNVSKIWKAGSWGSLRRRRGAQTS